MSSTYSEEAEQDLEDIWLYIAGNNPSAATEFVYKIKNACDVLLAENIEIVRIFHGAQDIETQF